MASSSGLIVFYLVCFVICNGVFIRNAYGFEQENDAFSVDQDDVEALKKFFKVSMSKLEHRLKAGYEGQIQELKTGYEGQIQELKSENHQQKIKLEKQIQSLKTELLDLQEKTEQDAYQVKKMLKHLGKYSETNAKIVSAKIMSSMKLESEEKHRHLSSRLEKVENDISNIAIEFDNEEVDSGGNRVLYRKTNQGGVYTKTHGRGRHLTATSGSGTTSIEDAAIWMQAGSGKMLFGPQADVNIYRYGADVLKTDDNFVVKQALRVEGDNYHLTIMLVANETVTEGDVISICEGYACVGYGFATMPPSSLGTAINGLKAIRLDDARLLVLYRDRSAGKGQSKAGSMTSGENGIKTMTKSTTPQKTFTTTAISSFDAAPFSSTNTSKTSMFVVCYQASGTNKGKCRIGQVTSLGTNELTYYPEKDIYSGAGDNYVNGKVDALGISKFLIASVNSKNAIRLQVCQFNRQSANFEISDCGTMEQDRGNKGSTDTDASYLAMASLTESTAILAYRYQKSGDVGRLAIVGITAKSPKFIAHFSFNEQSCRHFEVVRMTDTSAVVAYREPNKGFLAYGVIATHVVTEAGNHQIKTSTPVPIAPGSAIDNTYKLTLTRISAAKLMLGYRDSDGRLTLVDIDVVGTTLVVGSPQLIANIGASSSYDTLYLDKGNFGVAYQNDDDPTLANTGYVVFGETYGGSLRTGVATSSGAIGSEVQVAVTGIIKVPSSIVMTPGARYYGKYKGGLSSSSDDGVLLGRAMSSTHLLLERDFAGGFHSKEVDVHSSAYTGELRTLAGATIPSGWLPCNGQALNRITYSNLFNVISTTWGKGDGKTTFNIPDLRGRTTLGSGKAVATITSGVDSKKWKNPKPTNHVLGEYDGQESYLTPTANACSGAYSCTSTGGYNKAFTYTASTDSFNMGPYATVVYIIKT
eukprot:g4599.t1